MCLPCLVYLFLWPVGHFIQACSRCTPRCNLFIEHLRLTGSFGTILDQGISLLYQTTHMYSWVVGYL